MTLTFPEWSELILPKLNNNSAEVTKLEDLLIDIFHDSLSKEELEEVNETIFQCPDSGGADLEQFILAQQIAIWLDLFLQGNV